MSRCCSFASGEEATRAEGHGRRRCWKRRPKVSRAQHPEEAWNPKRAADRRRGFTARQRLRTAVRNQALKTGLREPSLYSRRVSVAKLYAKS
jgi:hypothetical protein